MHTITNEQAATIRAQYDKHRDWLGPRTSHVTAECSAEFRAPSNAQLSALEVFEFCRDIPARYFLYINAAAHEARTWTGDKLGDVSFGREYRAGFGDTRVPVTIHAINGRTYHGTYFKSAGDYARVKLAKR